MTASIIYTEGRAVKRVKVRIYSGVVCEMKVFNVPEWADVKKAKPPRPRFKDEDEREAHRLAISRRHNIQLVNANFSPTSLYSTLTLDDGHEVHTFPEARKLRDNFVRGIKRLYRDARLMIYMGRGKSTRRIHFHMLSEGVPEDVILKLWHYGEIKRCDHLRAHNTYNGVDHGQDYTGLANYLFDHWIPEQGGRRRWKQTANLLRPDKKKPVEVKREYSEQHPPRAPKGYILVESKNTKYGYCYFKFVLKPSPRSRTGRKTAGPAAGL